MNEEFESILRRRIQADFPTGEVLKVDLSQVEIVPQRTENGEIVPLSVAIPFDFLIHKKPFRMIFSLEDRPPETVGEFKDPQIIKQLIQKSNSNAKN